MPSRRSTSLSAYAVYSDQRTLGIGIRQVCPKYMAPTVGIKYSRAKLQMPSAVEGFPKDESQVMDPERTYTAFSKLSPRAVSRTRGSVVYVWWKLGLDPNKIS